MGLDVNAQMAENKMIQKLDALALKNLIFQDVDVPIFAEEVKLSQF